MILSIQFVQEIALALNLFCPFEVKKKEQDKIFIVSSCILQSESSTLYQRNGWLWRKRTAK